MNGREFESWLAGIERLTYAQSDQVARRLSHLAIEDARSGADATPGPEPDTRTVTEIELRWNGAYEATKASLVGQLRALLPLTDPIETEQAKITIAAVENLPLVGKNRGSLTIALAIARIVGDSDFFYRLDVCEEGFRLSQWENMKVSEHERKRAFERTLVRCRPIGEEYPDKDEDEEALESMRDYAAEGLGVHMSDEEWQAQVDLAIATDDSVVPNGIRKWLDSIPIGAEGESSENVSIRWEG